MKRATAQGLALAERDLAGFYQQGIGVHRGPNVALRLYRSAAEQGAPIAMGRLRELCK